MKKNVLFALFCLLIIPVLALTGCNSASSPDSATTTTTTTGVTTTTSGSTPIGSIMGTITLPGLAGQLWVGACTDPTFMTAEGWSEIDTAVASSDTDYVYVLPIYSAGTYYVLAALSVGTSEVRDTPAAGDRLGSYDGGGMPVGWGKTPISTPDPIYVSSGAETGKSFELLVTW
jgi:hypothetical protein